MKTTPNQKLSVSDLTAVVYSSGRVFNELSAGRLDTEKFLRSGSLEGITSKSDLALLQDLRDVAEFIIDHGEAKQSINAEFVRSVNATMTRSGALRPGEFRRDDQGIGVTTRYGEHAPPAMGDTGLQHLVDQALDAGSAREQALNLFVDIAKAQPFEDGNKRTAVFVANGLLIREQAQALLTVPLSGVEENQHSADEDQHSGSFNDLLARSYLYGEDSGVKSLMREHGLTALPQRPEATAQTKQMSRIAQPENGSYGVIDGVEITEEVIAGLVKNAEAGFPGATFRASDGGEACLQRSDSPMS